MRRTQRIAIVAFVLAALGAPLGAQGPEGVTVHGHWTIDVKNVDGTLVKRHDFENALDAAGALNMATFLGRVNSPGLWSVILYSPPGTPDCLPSGPPCALSENRWWHANGGDLTLSTSAGRQVVLTGSFTSPDTRSFISGQSGVRLCPALSAGCQQGSIGGAFTTANFAPISVQAGQMVQVTVVFTFS